jgi:hypothetical protein
MRVYRQSVKYTLNMQNNGNNSYKSNLALHTQQGKENSYCFMLMSLRVSANHFHTIEKHVNLLVYHHVTTYIKEYSIQFWFSASCNYFSGINMDITWVNVQET